MALSNDLISQFVKITNDDKPVKNESTIYGTTVNYNGGIYVRIDGSDRLTPVKTTTSDVLPDERVTVLIKNHSALITGNLTSPAARTDDVKDLDAKVDEQGNVITAQGNEIYAIGNKIAAINNTITAQDNELYLINNKIAALDNTVTAQDNELYAINNKIALIDNTVTAQGNELYAIDSRISTINDTITSQGNEIYAINNKIAIVDSSFQIKDGVVTGIKGIDTEWITTETLEAVIIDTDQIKGDYASFKNTVTDELVTAKGWMLEGSIGDAQISSLNANKLRAGTIDTAIVTVAGTDGRLQISDNTIQISDGSQVRVQMGKDASDDYTLAVWDADGNLIWDALGATENTIQRKIIRDKMVADDAAIQALKIDFQSFDTALTDQGVTISGTVVQVGSKTLNVALSEQTQAVTEHGELLTDHAAKIAANEKAISLRVTSQEFESYQTTTDGRLTDAESNIESAAGRLSTTESSITALQGQIALKVEQTDIDKSLEGYSTTTQMNAAIDLSKSGILTTVSDIYATQDNLEAAETIAEQAADKISWLVKNGTNSTNFTLTDRTATLVADTINANGLVRFSGLDSDTKDLITTAQTTANEAAADVLVAQNTADEAGKRATYHYGTCATAASSAVKIVTLEGFTLYRGATVSVKFTYANTAASPALNVNGTGAKSIYVYGASLGSSSVYNWAAGSTVQFVYNGTQWVMTDVSAMRAVADWCYSNNVSYINGAKIYAGTVTAKQINVTDLFAQDITATGTIRGVNLIGATGSFSGSVTATSGKIGLYELTENGLKGGTSAGNVILSPEFIWLWSGNPNGAARFYVDSDGCMIVYSIDATHAINTDGNISATGTVSASYQLKSQSIELSYTTPYIDFHYGNSTADYTSRIIESASGTLTVNGTAFYSGGKVTAPGLIRANGGVAVDGDINLSGSVFASGGFSAEGNLYVGSRITVDGLVYLHNVYDNQSSNTANVRIGSTGRMTRASSSSVRYKDLISVLSAEDVEALYDIPVHWFKYKADYLGKEDERYNKPIPGFVVEDWEDVLPIAIDHNPDKTPEMWNNNIVVPLIFEMVKNEHSRITEVNKGMSDLYAYAGRVAVLENTVENLREQLYEARNELHDLRAELAEQRAA